MAEHASRCQLGDGRRPCLAPVSTLSNDTVTFVGRATALGVALCGGR